MNAGAIAQYLGLNDRAVRYAGAGLLFACLLLPTGSSFGDTKTELERKGEYVLRVAGCAGCHTADESGAPPLAGGRKLETPFGVFYGPNITAHPQRGIGGWRLEDLTRALRHGESVQGRHLYPIFPYTSYAGMRDEDIRALKAYLESVPPSDATNQPHQLPWYLRYRAPMYFWKLLFHSSEAFEPRPDQSAEWNRGAYLVNVLGHCGECHTRRNLFGALERKKHLAGNPGGPDGEAVPNITSHRDDGIGDWSSGEIREYLRSGLLPDGDVAGGLMAEVIDESTSHLSDEDLDAMVTYLRTVPALEN